MAVKKPEKLNTKALESEESGASVVGVRKAVDETALGNKTPQKVLSLISSAAQLKDLASYFSLAEEIEERDPDYRSVLGTRKLAIVSLPIVVEPAGVEKRDADVATAVSTMLNSAAVKGALIDVVDAIGKGVSVSEIVWKTGDVWTPSAIKHRDQRWFTFDKDGETVLLRNDQGEGGRPLSRGKYIVHTPRTKSGLAIRSGLAMAAAIIYAIRSAGLKNWLGFVETYGQPARVGKYKKGTPEAAVKKLETAVRNFGSDFAAVISDDMLVEFVDVAGKNGSAEAFERLTRYLDEKTAKLVLGGTLTSGDGGGKGSFALGQVHGEVRADLLRADAGALAATLARDLVAPFVELNFGPEVAVPTVSFQLEEPEDVAGLTEALSKLVPLGLRVDQNEVRAKLGLKTPEEGAELLGQPVANAASRVAASVEACPVHGSRAEPVRDALDDVADEMAAAWERVSASATEQLIAAAMGSTDLQSMRDSLLAAVKSADVAELQALFTAARSKARAAGEAGVDI